MNMTTRVDTAVIGGGQAGLSAGFHLSRRGVEHVVLERGRIGETWRSERWDSFRLNTPNWFLQLPGHEYAGDDPDAFLTRDETVAYLESYTNAGSGGIETGTDVRSVRAAPGGGFELDRPVRRRRHPHPGDHGIPVRPRQCDHGHRAPSHPTHQGIELRTGGQARRGGSLVVFLR